MPMLVCMISTDYVPLAAINQDAWDLVEIHKRA